MAKQELQIVINAKDKTGSTFKKIADRAALAGSAVASAFAVKSVQAAIEFEKSMANVATLVDTNVENMEAMGEAVRRVASGTSVPLEELTSSLYDIRSAGIDASGAMNVLATAADLSVAGLSSAGEATDILTSAINSFGYEGEDANTVANILFKTVKAGKTTISGLAQSFGMVAPIASTAGISLEELSAATAALTTTGQKASVAQTQLKAAILAIQAPTDKMRDLFDKAGIKSGQLALKNDGLVETMNKIVKAAGGDADALKKAMGSSEALSATLALTGEQGEAFAGTMDMMRDSSDMLTEAVDKQNETFDKQWGLLKNNMKNAMIEFGGMVLPFATKAAGALSEALQAVNEDLKDGEINLGAHQTASEMWAKATIFFFKTFVEEGLHMGEMMMWVLDTARQFGEGFAKFVLGKAKAAMDQLKAAINAVIGALNKALWLINKLSLGRINLKIPKIGSAGVTGRATKMASGGIINEPISGIGLKSGKSYLMGEAGPEAVVPLSGSSSSSVSTVIQINMQGAHFYGNEKTLARKIGDELMRQINLNVKPAF